MTSLGGACRGSAGHLGCAGGGVPGGKEEAKEEAFRSYGYPMVSIFRLVLIWLWVNTYRYIFSGMNIHLPAILGFTRYQDIPYPLVK